MFISNYTTNYSSVNGFISNLKVLILLADYRTILNAISENFDMNQNEPLIDDWFL